MTNGNSAYDDKGYSPEAASRSVIDVPPIPSSQNPIPTLNQNSLVWFAGNYAQEITPWGSRFWTRDRELRAFINKEPYFASALNVVCARNAGFNWKLDGPPRTVNAVQDVLETANMGKGWQNLMVKLSIDLYTQDNGAFMEVVRTRDDETAPVIGLNHLDAQSCVHTGNPEAPVIYRDRLGKLHLLRWYQVITFTEMPMPVETLNGLQMCALSRMLMGALIQKNNAELEYEKTSGRETRAIHMVKGITSLQLQDAVNQAKTAADASGMFRYVNPILLGSVDPKADVGHDTINLADWAPSFDPKLNFDHYMNLISMAFATDYQDFAPLPGGGLGTGAQSEMLHLKSRGKGPARFMNMIAYAMNFCVVPKNIRFFWAEQDLEAEKMDAEVRAIRAQTRATRIQSFEITPQLARQIANDEGDFAPEFLTMIGEDDLTENVVIDALSPGATQNMDLGKPVRVLTPAPNRVAASTPNPTASRPRAPQANPQV